MAQYLEGTQFAPLKFHQRPTNPGVSNNFALMQILSPGAVILNGLVNMRISAIPGPRSSKNDHRNVDVIFRVIAPNIAMSQRP